MERRNDIPNLLAMYIRNTSDIYNITSWLQSCVIKKANKGIQPQVGYSVLCNEKIKKAFSFGNGTEKDFKRYCKDNKCNVISENEFYKELHSLPLNEQETHIQFIREQLNLYNDL